MKFIQLTKSENHEIFLLNVASIESIQKHTSGGCVIVARNNDDDYYVVTESYSWILGVLHDLELA